MKEITVHVISVLVVDKNCWLLFVRLVSLLLSAQMCLILYFKQRHNYFYRHHTLFFIYKNLFFYI